MCVCVCVCVCLFVCLLLSFVQSVTVKGVLINLMLFFCSLGFVIQFHFK